ncbi:MAG: gliding motility protein GldL [Bacteroidia bacterium]|nr:gliding motility protein GldL [Bacteroidia bacterium]MBP7269991.1 gliding motility protein GldL [Bacteroidia bacterium]MBP7436222.1 gliding motility protein GldL [Bacteroidia bacterium]MBP7728917.1 gliding motility protein GldL [Bacteroidia bacterium]MBP7772567.1 gliding motility protein GldL [Bacteroidia bacterium]
MAKLYGWGASIVIVGALFKIQHWPYSGFFLVLGLGTEAVIFFFSAFEPPHEDVDWSLVYPELAGMGDDDHGKREKRKKADPVAQKLDALMADAKIGPELIESLGTGLKSLGDNAGKLADLSDASVATNDYVKNVAKAATEVGNMSNSYTKAAAAIDGLSSSTEEVKVYKDQVVTAGKNLAALNAVYELQLQDSNEHLKQTSRFYEGINELMGNLNASLDDTRKYRDEVAHLAQNLSKLNTVYGNMLSAMTIKS